MATKNFTKQEEINVINELCNNDTYFAQYFAGERQGVMIENIKNDFSIEFNTDFDAAAHKYENEKLQEKLNQANAEINSLKHEINELRNVLHTSEHTFRQILFMLNECFGENNNISKNYIEHTLNVIKPFLK